LQHEKKPYEYNTFPGRFLNFLDDFFFTDSFQAWKKTIRKFQDFSRFSMLSAELTDGAVGRRPAGRTLAVAVPVVAGGVVGTVDAHLSASLAEVA